MKNIAILSIASLLMGCASIQVEPQARHTMVSPNPAPKECKFVGQVIGNQGNFFTGSWTSNKNLEEGAMNDLRNQASKLGGNYVQLLTSRAGSTGSYSYSSGSSEQTNVTNTGNAYMCPESALN